MPFMNMGQDPLDYDESAYEELEELLSREPRAAESTARKPGDGNAATYTRFSLRQVYEDEDDRDEEVTLNSDVQGALGLYAEATQDVATAGLELALGRHFSCVDYCNQAAEKAAQAVSLFHRGHRVMYDHDLRALGATVGAPPEVQEEMAKLTPFHPDTFYATTSPTEADESVSAEQAGEAIQIARRVLRWTRGILL